MREIVPTRKGMGGVGTIADSRGKARDEGGETTRAAVFWQGGGHSLAAEPPHAATTTERADVCVVGGGFTGLWAAPGQASRAGSRHRADRTPVLRRRRQRPQRRLGERLGRHSAQARPASARTRRFSLVDASRRSLDDIRETVRAASSTATSRSRAASLWPSRRRRSTASWRLRCWRVRWVADDYFRILDKDEAVALSGSPRAEAGSLILHAGSVRAGAAGARPAPACRRRRGARLRGHSDGGPPRAACPPS